MWHCLPASSAAALGREPDKHRRPASSGPRIPMRAASRASRRDLPRTPSGGSGHCCRGGHFQACRQSMRGGTRRPKVKSTPMKPARKGSGQRLIARPDCAGQPAVVGTIFRMPQGQSELDAPSQHVEFLTGSCRSLGRVEIIAFPGRKILVVPTLQNCLKNIPHQTSILPANKRTKGTGTPTGLVMARSLGRARFEQPENGSS